MTGKYLSFLKPWREVRRNSTAVSWVIAALLTGLADPATALGANRTKLSAQDFCLIARTTAGASPMAASVLVLSRKGLAVDIKISEVVHKYTEHLAHLGMAGKSWVPDSIL